MKYSASELDLPANKPIRKRPSPTELRYGGGRFKNDIRRGQKLVDPTAADNQIKYPMSRTGKMRAAGWGRILASFMRYILRATSLAPSSFLFPPVRAAMFSVFGVSRGVPHGAWECNPLRPQGVSKSGPLECSPLKYQGVSRRFKATGLQPPCNIKAFQRASRRVACCPL